MDKLRLPFIKPHFERAEVVKVPDGGTRVVAESDWYDLTQERKSVDGY
jgi:hypothetical protein